MKKKQCPCNSSISQHKIVLAQDTRFMSVYVTLKVTGLMDD